MTAPDPTPAPADLAAIRADLVSYWTCYSCLQPIAVRSGADVVTLYSEGFDRQGRQSPLCRNYHPDCSARAALAGPAGSGDSDE